MSNKIGFKPKYDITYEFTVRRIAEGQFKNLWEMRMKGPKDDVFIEVVDADHLSTCIGKMNYVFERDGF